MILFLAAFMKKGFGVSVVIDSLCKHYAQMGVDVVVGCQESDGFFQNAEVVELEPRLESVQAFAAERGCDVIVAHTTPFFELLPQLAAIASVWSWEHGDPDPEFFIWDRQERREIIRRKQRDVYHHLSGVVAISDFIKRQIEFEQATVIYNGCDHIVRRPDRISQTPSTVRIGTLVRLGVGETIYKGRPILTQLYRKLAALGVPIELHVMGKGTETDRKKFEAMGVTVHLNASDEERLEFLEDLDIFISTSLWEGFNLPLVEAQASGTVGLAFDTGAHPETTPIVTSGLDGMVSLIEHYCENPILLSSHSEMCERWVRDRFSWAGAAQQSAELFQGRQ